ncbi:MAG: two pore domain potassium channel family protein [Oricola sp.]|jgi:hypothetical protein|nr:two pore domain potassium channel family protein [Oricola sp.]
MESGGVIHQLLLNSALISATAFIHGVFVAAAAAVFRSAESREKGARRFLRDTAVLVLLVLWLMFAHMLEIALWAWTYLSHGMFESWEAALYFSGAVFTTLGFGDVLLPQEWRLLSGAEAANGLLLFGVSAAFLFDVVRRLHLGGKG